MAPIDYAAAFGFHSIPPAVALAAVYLPLFLWFIRQSIKNKTYVYSSLTTFCLMRLVAFALRAILVASKSLAENLGVAIAAEILFGVGFSALLYSAYTLVLDREIILAPNYGDGAAPADDHLPLVLKLTRDRRLFRIALLGGVALGIIGTSDATSSDAHKAATGTTLRRVGTVIFLVLAIVQALQTGLAFAHSEHSSGYSSIQHRRFGDRHGRYILCAISVCLLVREGFLVATLGSTATQNKELLWYPLVALPEVLAVCCFAVSGLVPPRAELQRRMEVQYVGVQP